MYYKAFKFRIYPNKEQELLINKTFGCCRFVYNKTLKYRQDLYKNENKSMSKFDCTKYMTTLKSEYKWLKEVDSTALNNSIFNMDSAYQKFFKEHAGYPKFKSKYDNSKSYTSNKKSKSNIAIDFENNKIKLPKMTWIKCKIHRKFEG